MKASEVEIAAMEVAAKEAKEDQLNELSELQLLLVGGGNGETIL